MKQTETFIAGKVCVAKNVRLLETGCVSGCAKMWDHWEMDWLCFRMCQCEIIGRHVDCVPGSVQCEITGRWVDCVSRCAWCEIIGRWVDCVSGCAWCEIIGRHVDCVSGCAKCVGWQLWATLLLRTIARVHPPYSRLHQRCGHYHLCCGL